MKNKHQNSRFSNFIKKAGQIIPEVLQAGTMLASGNVVGAIGHVGEILNTSTTDREKSEQAKELLNEFELKKIEFELEAYRIEKEDRQSARINGDKKLQRIVAYFSLIGFIVLGGFQLYIVFESMNGNLKMNEFSITTIAYFEGIFTAMLFTLKDYLYGGSMKDENF